jgi:hypothetical protein
MLVYEDPAAFFMQHLHDIVLQCNKLDIIPVKKVNEDQRTIMLAALTRDKTQVGIVKLQKTGLQGSEYTYVVGTTNDGKFVIDCFVARVRQQEEIVKTEVHAAITENLDFKPAQPSTMLDLIGDMTVNAFMHGYKTGKELICSDVNAILAKVPGIPAEYRTFAFNEDGDLLFGLDALKYIAKHGDNDIMQQELLRNTK